MQSKAQSVEEYLNELPEDRREAIAKLRKVVLKNLPKGFKEGMGYGMLCYSIPHSLYPAGYHCDPSQPVPFMSIASQKNFIAVYHMGVYAIPQLLDWYLKEYPKYFKTKPDMGKSCLRFKKPDQIPYQLLGELATKVTPAEWLHFYESHLKKK